ncbi:MAG: hypothetical protein Ta2G_14900 [Termitinemataceae bacterium]|nr:MAG: hypothetical protein Ta2G_14900 [Termitinemataceae bacterium]
MLNCKKKQIFLFLGSAALLVLVSLMLSSCKRFGADDDIHLPPTPPLSRPVIGYGVISSNYTHVLDAQGQNGKSLGFLRKGSIVAIIERRPIIEGEEAENWVLAKANYDGTEENQNITDVSGWLPEKELRIYPSKAQAKTAAETLPQ